MNYQISELHPRAQCLHSIVHPRIYGNSCCSIPRRGPILVGTLGEACNHDPPAIPGVPSRTALFSISSLGRGVVSSAFRYSARGRVEVPLEPSMLCGVLNGGKISPKLLRCVLRDDYWRGRGRQDLPVNDLNTRGRASRRL